MMMMMMMMMIGKNRHILSGNRAWFDNVYILVLMDSITCLSGHGVLVHVFILHLYNVDRLNQDLPEHGAPEGIKQQLLHCSNH